MPPDDAAKKRKEEEIKRMLRDIERDIAMERDRMAGTTSTQFKKYVKEEVESRGNFNWYEKLCKRFGNIIRINLGQKMKQQMEEDILISGLRITPDEVSSLVLTIMLTFLVIFLPFMILIQSAEKFFIPIIGLTISFYVLTYPRYVATVTKIRGSDEAIKALLYILIYLRLNPDFLGSIRFASAKCYGPIGYDLKKVMWDLETGKFTNVDDALRTYGHKWRLFDESFVKALEMLKGIKFIKSEQKRDALLRKALNFVLDSTYQNMKDYSFNLKNPLLMIHTMGITLPIFGLVMFPLISVFMSGEINITYVMAGYVIVLPLFLAWYIHRTISKRPSAFSHPDIEDDEPSDKFILRLGKNKHYIPLVPFCIFVFVLISLPGIIHLSSLTSNYLKIWGNADINGLDFTKSQWKEYLQQQYALENLIPNMLMTFTIIFGISVPIVIYFRAKSLRKEKIRKDVEKIESQFHLALYELGDIMESNIPLEKAIIYLIQEYEKSDKKPTEMLTFFKKVRNNLIIDNMMIEGSFFDKKKGVVWQYPSLLIRDISRIVVDSVRKGPLILSVICKSVSTFLTRLAKVEHLIRELLSETLSGIRLQIAFIAPFITAIVAAASSLLVQMIQQLSLILERIETLFRIDSTVIGDGTRSLSDSLGLIKLEETIPPTLLQLFIGIYLIEITLLLCLLQNGIEHGFDRISRDMLIARSLLRAVILFTIIVFVITVMFAPIIQKIQIAG